MEALLTDDNFISQNKIIRARFVKELMGNLINLSRGKGQLALSATKTLSY